MRLCAVLAWVVRTVVCVFVAAAPAMCMGFSNTATFTMCLGFQRKPKKVSCRRAGGADLFCDENRALVTRGGGTSDEEDDNRLEPRHMFAHRKVVRGGSAVMLALPNDVARLAYPTILPHRGRGGS